jgi:hypothetical protein
LTYYKGNAWQSEALVIVAEIYLLLEGFKRFADLDALTQNDLKLLLGWNVSQKEILENEMLPIEKDNWLLFHQASELVDDITVQRNWFYGLEHGKFALVLYFAFRNMPIANTLQLTSVTAMDLVYVPSAMPTRAIIKQQGENIEDIDFQYVALANFAEMQVDFTEKIARYPWADNVPFLIAGLTPVIYESTNYLKDERGAILPIPLDFESMKWWNILAISGGKSLTMFVLWNKDCIVPLGIMGRKRYVAI